MKHISEVLEKVLEDLKNKSEENEKDEKEKYMKKEIIKCYKATNKDLTCNNKKFEVGKWFKEEEAVLCSKGFHFCENPLDILNYYDLTDSKFFEIEAKYTNEEKREDDTKRVSKQIKLKAELNLKELISAGFEFIWSKATVKSDNDESIISNDERNSKVATSGYSSKVATSGDSSQVATSGYSSKVAIEGQYSVGANIGYNGKVKGIKGTWITLAEWKYDDNLGKYIPVCVKSAQIDGEELKENTYYQLINGEFTEL